MEQPRVTRIAIGRLHNLGNYEHIRYDVTVEIPEGAHDAGEVIHQLERMLGALAPVKKDYDIERAKKAIGDVQSNPDKLGVEYTQAAMEIHRSRIERHNAKVRRRQSALRAFNNLGGVETFTDAKRDWEDDDDYEY